MENKFKISLLTASVVMGLSFISIAQAADAMTPAQNPPAPPTANTAPKAPVSAFTIKTDTAAKLSLGSATAVTPKVIGDTFYNAFSVAEGAPATTKSNLVKLTDSITAINTARAAAGEAAYKAYFNNLAESALLGKPRTTAPAANPTGLFARLEGLSKDAQHTLLGADGTGINPSAVAATLFPATATALALPATNPTLVAGLADPLKLGNIAAENAGAYGDYLTKLAAYAGKVDKYYAALVADPTIVTNAAANAGGFTHRATVDIKGNIDAVIKALSYQYRQNVLSDAAKNVLTANEAKKTAFFNSLAAVIDGAAPTTGDVPTKPADDANLNLKKSYLARLTNDANTALTKAGNDPTKLDALFTAGSGEIAKIAEYIADGKNTALVEGAAGAKLRTDSGALTGVGAYFKQLKTTAALDTAGATTARNGITGAANTTLGDLNTALTGATTGKDKMELLKTALGKLLLELEGVANGTLDAAVTTAKGELVTSKDQLTGSESALASASFGYTDVLDRINAAHTKLATLTTPSDTNIATVLSYLDSKGAKNAALVAEIGALKTDVDSLNKALGGNSVGDAPFANISSTYYDEMEAATTAEQKQEALNKLIGSAKALVYGAAADTTPTAPVRAIPADGLLNLAKANLALGQLNLKASTKHPQESSNELHLKIAALNTALKGTGEAGTGGAIKAYNDARTAYLAAKAAEPGGTHPKSQALITAENDLILAAATLDSTDHPVYPTIAQLAKPNSTTLYTAEELNGLSRLTTTGGADAAASAAGPLAAFLQIEEAKTEYAGALKNLAESHAYNGQLMQLPATVLPFSTDAEKTKALEIYNSIQQLPGMHHELATKEAQKTEAEKDGVKGKAGHTLYLGGLSAADMNQVDANGDLPLVYLKKGADNKLINDKYDETDLYTGEKENRLRSTVLSIGVPGLTAGSLTGKNTIIVGGSETVDAQGNVTGHQTMEVFAATYQHKVRATDKDLNSRQADLPSSTAAMNPGVLTYNPNATPTDETVLLTQSGAAVTLRGNLFLGDVLDGTKDENGKARVFAGLTHPVDTIQLQNMNISNVVSNDLLTDGKLPTNATSADSIGLSITTNTVNAQVNTAPTDATAADVFDPQIAEKAPDAVNGILKNVNIDVTNTIHAKTEDNNDVRGNAIGIDLSGSANHYEIKGDHIKTAAAGDAIALRLSGNNNIYDVHLKTIKGDIVDMRHLSDRGTIANPAKDTSDPAHPANRNVVNLNGGTFDGNIESGKTSGFAPNYLAVKLTNGTWTGYSEHSPDILFEGSTWNLTRNSSTNYLYVAGSNTINMVEPGEVGQLPDGTIGRPLAHSLTVEKDLIATNPNAVTVLKIGTYDPNIGLRSSSSIPGLSTDYRFGTLKVDHLIYSVIDGQYDAKVPVLFDLQIANSGAEPVHVNQAGVVSLSPNLEQAATPFLSYNAKEAVSTHPVIGTNGEKVDIPAGVTEIKSNVQIVNRVAELGIYQYEAKELPIGPNRLGQFYVNTNRLSNSAATVASLAAAPASIASLEADALAKHMTSLRHSNSSGVWISYYGGSNQNTLSHSVDYDLKTNGVMLGVDTQLANQWLAGVAFTSAKSNLSTMQSTGDVNSYGAQFYLSRRYENGVFVDANAQFGHFSNRASARMLDGQLSHGDYASNGYGLGVKLGYAYQNQGFFAEPYIRATGRAFSGASYRLENGLDVNSTDYKSMLGEIGADLGYTVPTNTGYFKPYLHLAVMDEFANGNHVRINKFDVNNSINGAAFQVGVGAEVQVMKNLGGYVSYDYTTGGDLKRPWQATVGVNYTW